MLNKDDIMKIAGEKKLNPSAVSKDYALGWLLFGISKSSIGDKLIFKGGTALSKVHFPEGWRLSEDLDFTLIDDIDPKTLEKVLKEVSNAIEKFKKINNTSATTGKIRVAVQYCRTSFYFSASS